MGDPYDRLPFSTRSFKRKEEITRMLKNIVLVYGRQITLGNPRIVSVSQNASVFALIRE